MSASRPDGAVLVTSDQSIDGPQRRIGYRPLGYANLYVSDGMPTDTILSDWLQTMSAHLYFGRARDGLPVQLVLLTMRRTREFYAEAERRELAEQALRQAQKMEAVGQLTGGVAHDFNNLLTIIIGNLGIAQARRGRGARRTRARQRADRRRARRATDAAPARLLAPAAARPARGRRQQADRRACPTCSTRSLGENIALETISGAGLWKVEVDASELESTLLNLALNARDAMPDGGKLTIETSNAYLDDEYCRAARRHAVPANTC